MICAGCAFELPAAVKFCPECGARVAARCAACNAELLGGAKFCAECGASAAASPAPGSGRTAPERSPRTYTPKHLADKILQSKSALEGERKQVTVLFADVKGSMELAEQLDPEQWHRILERFFEILTEGVHRFEGTVNQYTGDGIMALFGAPIAHEDHAQRACYAALHLRDALRDYADELRRTEQRHDAVAGVLVDGAFEAVHAFGEDLEEALEDAVPRFGIELLGQLHRAFDVGEQHRDLLALAFERGLGLQDLVGEVLGGVVARGARLGRRGLVCGFQRRAAGAAEAMVGRIRMRARRAGLRQRCPAAPTEAVACGAHESACGAAHKATLPRFAARGTAQPRAPRDALPSGCDRAVCNHARSGARKSGRRVPYAISRQRPVRAPSIQQRGTPCPDSNPPTR